jgi:hypothetical protein
MHNIKWFREDRTLLKSTNTNLIRRLETKMLFVKPVLAQTTLYHLYLFFSIRIWIRAATSAIQTFKVVIVRILNILNIFTWGNLAVEFTKL